MEEQFSPSCTHLPDVAGISFFPAHSRGEWYCGRANLRENRGDPGASRMERARREPRPSITGFCLDRFK